MVVSTPKGESVTPVSGRGFDTVLPSVYKGFQPVVSWCHTFSIIYKYIYKYSVYLSKVVRGVDTVTPCHLSGDWGEPWIN